MANIWNAGDRASSKLLGSTVVVCDVSHIKNVCVPGVTPVSVILKFVSPISGATGAVATSSPEAVVSPTPIWLVSKPFSEPMVGASNGNVPAATRGSVRVLRMATSAAFSVGV
ncbi:MAG: hypothetical protein ACI89X_004394 [Planctomycetota bacterium]|jgi:hypothetical protein